MVINNMDIHSDSILGFFSGDFLATIITTSFLVDQDWIHPTLKLIFIILGGLCGGFFGLLGQRLFKKVENWYDNR